MRSDLGKVYMNKEDRRGDNPLLIIFCWRVWCAESTLARQLLDGPVSSSPSPYLLLLWFAQRQLQWVDLRILQPVIKHAAMPLHHEVEEVAVTKYGNHAFGTLSERGNEGIDALDERELWFHEAILAIALARGERVLAARLLVRVPPYLGKLRDVQARELSANLGRAAANVA